MKKLYMFAIMFLISLSLANALSLSNLNLQGSAGQTLTGTITATNNNPQDIDNLTILASNLVSGSDNILSSSITLQPTFIPHLSSGSSQTISVAVNIPAGKNAGTYNGAVVAYYGNQSTGSTLSVNVQANTTTGSSFTISEVDVGSNSQKREESINSNVRLTNTGSLPLTIQLTPSISTDYQFTLSQTSAFLNPGDVLDIPFTIYVPASQDAGNHNIGTITARSGSLTRVANIAMNAENDLVISKIRLESSDGDSKSISDGGTFDVKPGVDVKVTVTVKNEFSDSVDIRDITLDVNSDGDLDASDNYDMNDLSHNEKDTVDFSFNVPTDADGSSTITFNLEGTDENGARHGVEKSVDIDAQKKSNEISIKTFSINPTTVSCDRRVVASFTIENTGRNDQQRSAVDVSLPDFDIEQRFVNINLDSGSKSSRTYSFMVPNNALPGQYYVRLESFYDNDISTDLKTAELNVAACGSSNNQNTNTDNSQTNQGTNQNNQQANQNTQPPVVFPSGTSGPSYGTQTSGAGFTDTTTYIIILAVAVLILLVIIIIMIAKYVF